MPADVEARIARVKRVVDAARSVATDGNVVAALLESSGLSREGVMLALGEHLELAPSDAELASLVARATPTSHVHVVLSANVFVGALRAIACAVAAAPKVTVQISSRESAFATALVDAIADPAICAADRAAITTMTGGEIHVYGRSETIAAIRGVAPPGVPVRAHGPGFGVAFVGREDLMEAAATALASDVVVFDQRGCLSPRVAFVAGSSECASAVARAIAIALEAAAFRVPRGALSAEESSEAARYVETMRFAGEAIVGTSSVVGVSDRFVLPPAGRHLHVVAVAGASDLASVLGEAGSFVTSIGASDRAIASFFPGSVRVAALGEMQKPPFDGPVDLRSF